jgi:hypothetical protein
MNLRPGRARRADDWPSSHTRARSDLSDRMDGPIEPAESAWLDAHLRACAQCRTAADAYAAQRLELRSLLDRMPQPPRDLWARTAAAIESESAFRDRRSRSAGRRARLFAPTAVLAAALVVVVAVGTLTSSQRRDGGGTTTSSAEVAVGSQADAASDSSVPGGPTPIPAVRKVEYLARVPSGGYSIQVARLAEVCPESSTEPCDTTAPTEQRPVAVETGAGSVFGSPDGDQLLIVYSGADSAKRGTVSVVERDSGVPTASPSPSPTPTATATRSSLPSHAVPSMSIAPSTAATPPVGSSAGPSATPSSPPSSSPPASPSASPSPSPSVAVTPSPAGGSIEIARDVVLVSQSAAYSTTGDWFAFTARPADDSTGPDIYLWRVGDARAIPITSDHRSVFGSWAGDVLVGSTVVETPTGSGAAPRSTLVPQSFALDPASKAVTLLPQTGRAWRPTVDPTNRRAVYWSGTVKATADPGLTPEAGRLVVGDWGATTRQALSGPRPTPLAGDQTTARNETTIASGRIGEWDARWDPTGSRLAVWIADPGTPGVGRLSLYAVDPFDGSIDLKKPLLAAKPATAGFSITDGTLVWAGPAADGTVDGERIQVLAWTDQGIGGVETVPGPVIVIR